MLKVYQVSSKRGNKILPFPAALYISTVHIYISGFPLGLSVPFLKGLIKNRCINISNASIVIIFIKYITFVHFRKRKGNFWKISVRTGKN